MLDLISQLIYLALKPPKDNTKKITLKRSI